jgi:hypothetical protein
VIVSGRRRDSSTAVGMNLCRSDQDFKVLSDDFHPIALKSFDVAGRKIEYIHHNPVRKGFVERPEQWKCSSARNWLLEDDSIIPIDRSRLS